MWAKIQYFNGNLYHKRNWECEAAGRSENGVKTIFSNVPIPTSLYYQDGFAY